MKIHVPSLFLQFTAFDTERGTDIVEVWTGARTLRDSKLVKRLSGNIANPQTAIGTLYSDDNHIIVTLTSDSTVQGSGFTAEWNTGNIS